MLPKGEHVSGHKKAVLGICEENTKEVAATATCVRTVARVEQAVEK